MRIKLYEEGDFVVQNSCFYLKSSPISICLLGEDKLNLCFSNSYSMPSYVAGEYGNVYGDIAEFSDLEVKREFFINDDSDVVAMRIIVKNKRNSEIRLKGIKPIEISKESDFTFSESQLSDLKVLRYPFNKMDIPSYFKPSVVNKDFEDAVFSQIHAIPGQGVVYDTMNTETRTVTSGPIIMLRNDKKTDTPSTMLAALGVDNHLVDMKLTTTENRQNLENFEIFYNFDGVAIASGEEVCSHWLMIKQHRDEGELLSAYADAVANENNLKLRKPGSPTVYCSWYFYTFEFTQQHLVEELECIESDSIPIDVFQIDDGWMDYYGSYEPDRQKFPNGMAYAAKLISAADMVPGIWACPYVIDVDSPILDKYPDIYQCKENGDKLIYDTSTNDCYVLDPTRPGAKEFLVETFNKFLDWGYRYFKLDWLRAIYEFDDVVFYDPKVNRLMAYRMALKWIREILGNESYILACGGLSDPGNVGLVDGQRICKDVKGMWEGPLDTPKSGTLVNIKQNIMRNYSNRFWDADPDATQIRLRDKPFSPNERKCMGVYHSQGSYTEEEAFTVCAHQYITGGLICISERFPELQQSRKDMFRHIVPSFAGPSKILDFDHPDCPTMFFNEIIPKCRSLEKWWILAIANWEEKDVTRIVELGKLSLGTQIDKLAIFEFREQKFHGIKDRGDIVEISIPSHGIRVFRLTPWDGIVPKILGTDLHITGGGYEITQCEIISDAIYGTVNTKWKYPISITAGFPAQDKINIKNCIVDINENQFKILK